MRALALLLCLSCVACSGDLDGDSDATPDTGSSDAGQSDADVGADTNTPDADASSPDTMVDPPDVGMPDMGSPDVGSPDVGMDTSLPDADGPPGPVESDVQQDAFSATAVEMLIYRVEFPDRPFDWDEADIRAAMTEVQDFFEEESIGRFAVTYTLHPEIHRARWRTDRYRRNDEDDPELEDNWPNYLELLETVAAEDGVDIDAPGEDKIVMVIMPVDSLGYNSAAGPPLIKLFHHNAPTIAHELGHALGLHHARGIEGGDTIFGTGDYETESINYGNTYCLMGSNGQNFKPINLLYRSYFNWLQPNQVPRVTESGTYRIYAIETGDTDKQIGITLHAGTEDYIYWLEYRLTERSSRFPAPDDGVLFNLQGYFDPDPREDRDDPGYWTTDSYLLDMTPGSQPDDDWALDDTLDSQLKVGETYIDEFGGFSVTTARVGQDPTGERWVEVDVTFP